jgi:hypothetical protein
MKEIPKHFFIFLQKFLNVGCCKVYSFDKPLFPEYIPWCVYLDVLYSLQYRPYHPTKTAL